MTNDLRIADAPELVDVSGDEKIPTGGYGNYATTINQISEFAKNKYKLATEVFVEEKVNNVDEKIKKHSEDLDNPHKITKDQIGLSDVDNTSDVDKPISIYTQTALDNKADKSSTYTKNETDVKLSNKVESVNGKKGLNITLTRDDVGVPTDEQIKKFDKSDEFVITESGRTQREKNRDIVHVLDFKKGKTDQQAMQDAVDYCIENNRVLNWDGAHLTSTTNIVGFWTIENIGNGSITRNGNVFYIEPSSTQVNIQYVAPASAYTVNDGIAPDFPIAIGSLVSRITAIGWKSALGQWRFQFREGTYTSNGLRWNNLPTFNKPLQFYGVTATDYNGISSIWKSPAGSNVYAMRAENTALFVNAEFKYLRFEGWETGGSNSGALLFWNPCRIIVDTCAFVKCAMGVATRYGYSRVINSLFEDNITWGVSGAYQNTANVGNLAGGGNVFIRSGVDCSRTSIMYIQGNEFIDCANPITCSRVSRIRTQKNTFTSWTGSAIRLDLNSSYTPDNDAGSPDNIVQTPTMSAPFYSSATNSSHLLMERSSGGRHLSSSTVLNLQGEEGATILFNNLSSEWVPFRIPAYTMYCPFKMTVEVMIRCPANSGGLFELHGQGYSATSRLGQITLPSLTTGKDYRVVFDIWNTSDTSALVAVSCPALSIESMQSVVISSTAFRDKNETSKAFRFYFTPSSSTEIVQFRHFSSKVML